MVQQQLVPRGIRDPKILAAMAAIPRHEFIPAETRHLAYQDGPVSIGRGQTISQPSIVAWMTELLRLRGVERVLEIGAGCGYQTALLSRLATQVCSLELDPDLYGLASENLRRLDVHNVDLRIGSGYDRWPTGGDFDAILSACAPLEVPEVLVDQLARGGRLVIPVGPTGQNQELLCLFKTFDGKIIEEARLAVRFVPMRSSHFLS